MSPHQRHYNDVLLNITHLSFPIAVLQEFSIILQNNHLQSELDLPYRLGPCIADGSPMRLLILPSGNVIGFTSSYVESDMNNNEYIIQHIPVFFN